jgi:hypothetical protein
MPTMSRSIRLLGALALAGAITACSDSSGPASAGPAVQMSIATAPAVTPAPGMNMSIAPVTYDDGTNTLVITQVEMVVKELELQRVEGSVTCAEDVSGEDDDCEEIELDAFLLDLPLSPGATQVISVPVDTGSYDEFEFKIHKPESGDDDDAFLAAHPDFEGVSIRVHGTWNGAPFTYETDLDAEQEIDLVPPLVVTEAGATDFTLFIDLGTWFRAGDNTLIDPSSANVGQANEGVVKENIKNSFEAFEDEDHDGSDDD